MLAIGQPSMGIFSGEGGQFIGGHGMREEAKLRTSAALSIMWDGTPIRRVRAGDGAVLLPGRRLALHLMVQPDVGNMLLSDSLLADQGLLSRLLVTAPPSAAGSRFWREPDPDAQANIRGIWWASAVNPGRTVAGQLLANRTSSVRERFRLTSGTPDLDRVCRLRRGRTRTRRISGTDQGAGKQVT